MTKPAEYQHVCQPFAPVCPPNARVLVLGSIPSVKSRQDGFYYGHPANRFWRMLAAVTGREPPNGKDEKIALLWAANVALYDVIAACDVRGSGDASIRNAVAADLTPIFRQCKIEKVLLNGKTAFKLYQTHHPNAIEGICMPSTSPANAAWTLDRLVEAWGEALCL